MQKALIYCRVSSERQKNEGHGLDSQEHRCREHASRKGYEIERVFPDSFSGGGDFMNRPEMSKLLGYLDKNPHTSYVVIFDDLKRFARDVVFHWKLRNEFDKRKAKIECLNHTFEDTPEGKFIETILASQGQLEREQNRRQVIQKMKAGLEQGRYVLGGTPPPGYKRIKRVGGGKILVIDEPVAKIVIEAFEGFASGRFISQEEVRKFLVEKKFRHGKPVYLETTKRLLRRLAYTGYIEYPKWDVPLIKAEHEPILSMELYNKVQDKLDGKVVSYSKKIINPDFPVRGFVLCSECREPMTASWSTGGQGDKFGYYRCKTNGCEERNKSTSKKTLEAEFEAILAKIKPSQRALDLTKAVFVDVWKKKQSEIDSKQHNLEIELKTLAETKVKILERIEKATNESVISSYEERLAEMSQKEAVLKKSIMSFNEHRPSIETALGIVFDFLKNPLKQWQSGNIYTQRLVLRLVFEENLVYNRKSGFETAILSLPLRVFGLPEAQKSNVVEVAGIEPACEQDSLADLYV